MAQTKIKEDKILDVMDNEQNEVFAGNHNGNDIYFPRQDTFSLKIYCPTRRNFRETIIQP